MFYFVCLMPHNFINFVNWGHPRVFEVSISSLSEGGGRGLAPWNFPECEEIKTII